MQSVPAVFHCYVTILTDMQLSLSLKDYALSFTACNSLFFASAQILFFLTEDQLALWVSFMSVSTAHHHPKAMGKALCNGHLFELQKWRFSSLLK